MTLDIWIPFVFASALILMIPGPTIILVISQALCHGRRSVAPLVVGVLLGDAVAMTFSLLGLGALLSASAVFFGLFKWMGAAYLIWLGIKLWRSNPNDHPETKKRENRPNPSGYLLKRSFVATVLNPKSIVFFVAFFPQFIDPLRPASPQLIAFGGTFLFLAVVNATLYALFASRLSGYMRRRHVYKWLNRFAGSALIGAGVVAAGVFRRS